VGFFWLLVFARGIRSSPEKPALSNDTRLL